MEKKDARSDPWHLQRRIGETEAGGVGDGELLARFAAHRDEAAFELLVWRHHRLVLSVCRKVLREPHLADDAFQATFLILARKAGTIKCCATIAAWLYRVAYRCALRARRAADGRVARAMSVPDLSAVPAARDSDPGVDREETSRLLTAELARLPERYRLPVVLCYLEGRTYDEAAARLGCPKGTLSTRLTKARELLRSRLAARGLVIPAAALTTVLTEFSGPAAQPALLTSTMKLAMAAPGPGAAIALAPNAATLAEGVLRAMFWERIKVVTLAAFALAALGTGIGVTTHPPVAAQHPAVAQKADPPPVPSKGPENEPGEEAWWLKSIDKEGGTIEVESCDPVTLRPYAPGAVPPVEVRVGAGAEILIDGKPAAFSDLIPGIPIRFKFDSFAGSGIGKLRQGSGTILKLRTAQERTLHAVVDAVAQSGKVLTVIGDAGRTDYQVAADARITVDGKEGRASDLKTGMSVSLRLSAAYPVIFAVTAIGPRLEGVVRGVDTDRKTLTVLLRSPRLVVSGLWADGASITVGGKAATLVDLKSGTRVEIQWAADPDTRRVLIIRQLEEAPK